MFFSMCMPYGIIVSTLLSRDSIPKEYTKTFNMMIHWGPYGQFWEDFKNENWKIAALATIFLLYGLRIVIFMFVKARGAGGDRPRHVVR